MKRVKSMVKEGDEEGDKEGAGATRVRRAQGTERSPMRNMEWGNRAREWESRAREWGGC